MKRVRPTESVMGMRGLYAVLAVFLAVLLFACADQDERKAKYFDSGMEYYDKGDYKRARLQFRNALRIDPKDAESYFMFASIEEKEENWRKAFALFMRASELDPRHVEAQVHLGLLYALGGKPEEALEAAEKALAVKPDDAGALVLKGLAQARLGDTVAATEAVEDAVKIDPGNIDGISLLAMLYSDQGQRERAMALVEQGLADNPDNLVLRLLLARFYDEAGDTDKTVAQLQAIIDLAPEDLQHRNRLAAYYHSKGMTEQAEQVLREAIALAPDDSDAKLTLVKYLRERGENERSEQVLQEFISQTPEAYELQLGLASLLIGSDRNAEALDVLDGVIANAGESESARRARTKKAAVLLADGRHEQAAEEVAVVLDEDPRDTEALLIRAGISMVTDDPDKGIADLRTLLKERPGHVPALRLKARAHAAKNEMALARQSLEWAIEAEPQEVNANVELTQLLIQSGEFDAAVAVLERMRRFAPDDQSILVAIAEIRVRQERWDEVAALAAMLIKKNPELALGYHYKGLVLQAGGDHEQAILAFEEALQRKPNASEPLIALAKSLLATGRGAEALARVQRVVDANPEHYIALNLTGEILLALERFDSARSAFEQAIALKPEWPTPYRNLTNIALVNEDSQAAKTQLKAGFEATGDAALGIEYAQMHLADNREEAKRTYKAILERQPDVAAARNNLAVLLVKGEPDQKALDRALALVVDFELSDNPAFLDTLGWVRFKRDEPRQAVKNLQRAHDLLGEQQIPEISYHLAEAYAATGRNAEAAKLLEGVMASNSQFEGRERARALLRQLQ